MKLGICVDDDHYGLTLNKIYLILETNIGYNSDNTGPLCLIIDDYKEKRKIYFSRFKIIEGKEETIRILYG